MDAIGSADVVAGLSGGVVGRASGTGLAAPRYVEVT